MERGPKMRMTNAMKQEDKVAAFRNKEDVCRNRIRHRRKARLVPDM